MLNLPDVTLVMIETLEHKLACLAVEECLNKATFGDVLIFTDKPEEFYPIGDKLFAKHPDPFINVPNWPTKLGWSQCSWYGPPEFLTTSHALYIQWDSWIWDPTMWRDDYLKYDIIGAPWWYTDGKNVGNLGFSIRSTSILRYLLRFRNKVPCNTDADDDLLCRHYRKFLEMDGFSWAPEALARDFAFECTRPSPTSRHFGFHAAFNFNQVLDQDALRQRAELICASPYIKRTGHIWNSFAQNNPALVSALTAA